MLFGCFFENSSYVDLLSTKSSFYTSINQSDLDNHCSSHSNDCDSNETECNICHSAHCVYIGTPSISANFVKISHEPLLKEPKLYYFSYISILLRPPIS